MVAARGCRVIGRREGGVAARWVNGALRASDNESAASAFVWVGV